MKNIFVPTDFSDCALEALRIAALIARKSAATVTLVHIYERPVYGFVDMFYDNEAEKEILEKIDREIVALMKSDFLRGLPIKKILLTDVPLVEMFKNPRIKNADLIVMGSHGASGIKELLIGSNTEKVIRISDVPVLVIKGSNPKFNINSVVYASTFDQESDDAFVKIKKLTAVFNSVIHLLKVNTRNYFERTPVSIKAMNSFAEEFSLKNYTVNTWNDSTIEDGILNFSDHIGADLIALETHGRTGIAHLVQGSIAEDIVNHIPKPVLSIRQDRKKLRSSKSKSSPAADDSFNAYRPSVI